jgi:hypothetical protein
VIENVIDVTVIFVIFVIFVRLGETTVTLSASTAKGPFSQHQPKSISMKQFLVILFVSWQPNQ